METQNWKSTEMWDLAHFVYIVCYKCSILELQDIF